MSAADLPHFVYRCYDIDGDLLYVGCSKDVEKRLADHAKSPNSWVPCVQFLELEEHPDLKTARTAESEAIATEHPYWNDSGRWQGRHDWTELEYQRWGHMLLRARSGIDRGVHNVRQTEALHRLYMLKFGHAFPADPKRGSSRRRYDIEAAA